MKGEYVLQNETMNLAKEVTGVDVANDTRVSIGDSSEGLDRIR